MAELPASFTHELNVEAYAAIVRAFYSGPLKWEHETLLSKLRELFNFNDEMHLAIRREQEEEIQNIRDGAIIGRAKSKYMAPAISSKHQRPTYSNELSDEFDSEGSDMGRPKGGVKRKRPLTASGARDRRPSRPIQRVGSSFGRSRQNSIIDDPYNFVGRRVWRFWPNESPPWVEGYVLSYDPITDSHRILYDPNTGDMETQEEFNFLVANPQEFMLDSFVPLANMSGSRRQHEQPVVSEVVPPPPVGGYGGMGLGGAPSLLKRRKSAAVPVPPLAPFDDTYLASRLDVAAEDELTQMLVVLEKREMEVAEEIASLEDMILHGADLDKRAELEKQFEELCKKEMEIMEELKVLREAEL